MARDRRRALSDQRVRRPFEGERHRDRGELGGEQQHQRAEHAQLQVGAVGRPDVGPQVDHGAQERAAVCSHRGHLRRGGMAIRSHSGSG